LPDAANVDAYLREIRDLFYALDPGFMKLLVIIKRLREAEGPQLTLWAARAFS
jgi:hypothetical protein